MHSSREVQIGNDTNLYVFYKGHLNIVFSNCVFRVKDLSHIPEISYNLLFVHRALIIMELRNFILRFLYKGSNHEENSSVRSLSQ